MSKITVIVPVYNVEKYLDRCITSITSQSYKDIQIILVDDGSTDSSSKQCEMWAAKDSRICVIHKENSGLGYARNSGLEMADGDYISFIDSDDYVDPDIYSKLIKRITEHNADICYFGCNYDANGKITEGKQVFPPKVFDPDQIREEILPISFGTSITKEADLYGIGSVCCGIYKRSLFEDNHLRFGSEREVLCEDILFTSILLTKAQRVVFLNENLYYYCYNSTSLTHTFRLDRFEKSKKFFDLQNAVISQNNLGSMAKLRSKYSFMINIIVCLKQETQRGASYKEIRSSLLSIANNETFKMVYRSLPVGRLNIKKRLLFGSLYYKCIDLTYFLLRFRQ